MTSLNRSKPFGTVFGGGNRIKYKYEQDDKKFNAMDKEVDAKGNLIAKIDDPSIEAIKASLDEKGIEYHYQAGRPKLLKLLQES